MKCSRLVIEGTDVIVCGTRRYIVVCKNCGRVSTRLCDWKTAHRETCDYPLCDDCTMSPAKSKDLCPLHAKLWEEKCINEKDPVAPTSS